MLLGRALAVLLATTLFLGGCAQAEPEEAQQQAQAPSSVTLRTAPNDPDDPNIAVLEFLPEEVSVLTGTEVSWTFDGPEPHSVTFSPKVRLLRLPEATPPSMRATKLKGRSPERSW